MCTVKFSIELDIFLNDGKDLNTKNIYEKSEQIFKMEDASVSHPPGKV